MAENSGVGRGASAGVGAPLRPVMAAAARAGQSFAFLILLLTAPLHAHEMQASVADIDLADGRVTIDMRTNLEAMIAGVGSGHDDTDESPVAAEYDALRALPPEALRARLDAFAPELLDAVEVMADGAPVPLSLGTVETVPQPDPELPRDTRLMLTGDLPAGAEAATIRMAPSLGDLIVRGTGENVDYGEFLEGGATSRAIPVTGGGAWSAFKRLLGLGG